MKKQVNLALPPGGTLALVVLVVAGLTGSANEKNRGPTIKKRGTIDLLMVETTPVVFKDRLCRFEYVRDNNHANKTGASYFRFIDVATGKATLAFAKGQHLGCAFVEGGTSAQTAGTGSKRAKRPKGMGKFGVVVAHIDTLSAQQFRQSLAAAGILGRGLVQKLPVLGNTFGGRHKRQF